MRLTLRTLLAYLDDTLEPNLAREIGQKVAESSVAQELIDRIKKITRRRGLANPPATGPAKIDPNTLAEYLDNGLSAEQTTEVEETCLADDTYLAEVAACHQILTLMLSEPAVVPPTARRRMYRLVKGRESIPYRRPPVSPAVAEPGAPADTDRFGPDALPLPPSGARLFWPLAAAVVLAVALAGTIYMAIPEAPAPAPVAANQQVADASRAKPAERVVAPAVVVPTQPARQTVPAITTRQSQPAPQGPAAVSNPPAGAQTPPTGAGQPAAVKPTPPTNPPAGAQPGTGQAAGPQRPAPAAAKIPTPSPDAKPLGRLEAPAGPDTAVVLLRRVDRQPWQRVRANDAVSGNDRLLGLPTFAADVRLESGVGLRLVGNLPGSNGADPSYPLYESEVILHAPPAGFDADLTLDLGRIHLTNRKPQGEAKVLVRFRDQAWQVTLLDGSSEVIMDLLSRYQEPERFLPTGGEPPTLGVALGAVRGQARLQTDPYATVLPLQAAPAGQTAQAPVLAIWESKAARLVPVNAAPTFWGRKPQTPDQRKADLDLDQAKRTLHQKLSRPDSAVEVALAEMVAGQTEASRKLAVYCLEAIKALPALVDALQDEQHKDVRDAAVQALIHYVGSAPDNNRRLFEVLTQVKEYKPEQAGPLVQLLQGIPEADKADPKMYQFLLSALNDDRLGLRELAARRLDEIDPGGVARVRYNPTAPPEQRAQTIALWAKQLESKIPKAGQPSGRQ